MCALAMHPRRAAYYRAWKLAKPMRLEVRVFREEGLLVQVTIAIFDKTELHFSENNLDLNFSDAGVAHLHTASYEHSPTAYIALPSVKADKAHVVCRLRIS